jgi:predicted GIY-YIG superfamily endonuclease
MARKKGTVYLLHLDKPYRHAAHYLGFTASNDPTARIEEHAAGRGARLMEVVVAAGIGFRLVRTWPNGTRNLERRLKRWKKSGQLCPVCRAAKDERESRRAQAGLRCGRRGAA